MVVRKHVEIGVARIAYGRPESQPQALAGLTLTLGGETGGVAVTGSPAGPAVHLDAVAQSARARAPALPVGVTQTRVAVAQVEELRDTQCRAGQRQWEVVIRGEMSDRTGQRGSFR